MDFLQCRLKEIEKYTSRVITSKIRPSLPMKNEQTLATCLRVKKLNKNFINVLHDLLALSVFDYINGIKLTAKKCPLFPFSGVTIRSTLLKLDTDLEIARR